jgi:hypothetical protein
MGRKRKPSAHQKQIRFIAFVFGMIMLLAVVGVLLMTSRPVGGYSWQGFFHH